MPFLAVSRLLCFVLSTLSAVTCKWLTAHLERCENCTANWTIKHHSKLNEKKKKKPMHDNPLKASSVTLGGKVSFQITIGLCCSLSEGWAQVQRMILPRLATASFTPLLIHKKEEVDSSKHWESFWRFVDQLLLNLYYTRQRSKKIKEDPDHFSHHGRRSSEYSLQLFDKEFS